MFSKQLYRNQELKGEKYLRTKCATGNTIYYRAISPDYIKCSNCNSIKVMRHGGVMHKPFNLYSNTAQSLQSVNLSYLLQIQLRVSSSFMNANYHFSDVLF